MQANCEFKEIIPETKMVSMREEETQVEMYKKSWNSVEI